MTREIKFRAWDKILNKFVECSPEQVCLVRGEFIKHSEIEISQYTGLKDKNGKEIYEGDIVKIDDGDGWDLGNDTVVFQDGAFGLKEDNSVFMDSRITEVIGNIYENPELVK